MLAPRCEQCLRLMSPILLRTIASLISLGGGFILISKVVTSYFGPGRCCSDRRLLQGGKVCLLAPGYKQTQTHYSITVPTHDSRKVTNED